MSPDIKHCNRLIHDDYDNMFGSPSCSTPLFLRALMEQVLGCLRESSTSTRCTLDYNNMLDTPSYSTVLFLRVLRGREGECSK